jgi:hypothetical protein
LVAHRATEGPRCVYLDGDTWWKWAAKNRRRRFDVANEPKLEGTPVAPADVRRIRTELVDAGIAARRTLERLRLAHVVIAAAAQVVIAFIAWRIWVWRARRRRR